MTSSSLTSKGVRTSEYKSLRNCFYVGVFIALYGIAKGADLMGLAALIPAVCSPMMVYAGARSYVKGKNGEPV
jgi:hypothetical protein